MLKFIFGQTLCQICLKSPHVLTTLISVIILKHVCFANNPTQKQTTKRKLKLLKRVKGFETN